MMTQQRLTHEALTLEKYFSGRYKFINYDRDDYHLDVGVFSTTGNKVYRLKIKLNGFPFNCPEVLITHPTPLRDRNGSSLQRVCHEFHTLGGEGDFVKLCHYSKEWTSNISLFYVILKAKIWIEAYEGHLATGNSIDHYVKANY
jgi:hypothetical protein